MKYFLGYMLLCAPIFGMPVEGLVDLAGNPVKLEHNKNKELVVFWATWCPECKEKLAEKLPNLNKSHDVAVLTINTDRNAKRAKSYVKKAQVSLPVYRDPSRSLRKSLKVFSVPHWAVYEKHPPNSVWKLVDSAPAFEWERIEKALKKRG